MTEQDNALIRMMRNHWQDEKDALSGEDLSRLNHARQQALATMDRPGLIRQLLPARLLMATASAMLLLMIGLHLSQPDTPQPASGLPQTQVQQDDSSPNAFDNDLELLADIDSLDLITELDFYQWLELELDEEQTL